MKKNKFLMCFFISLILLCSLLLKNTYKEDKKTEEYNQLEEDIKTKEKKELANKIGEQYKEEIAASDKKIKAILSGNMETAYTELFMDNNSILSELAKEYGLTWKDTDNEITGEGVIGTIFSMATVEIKNIDDFNVTYRIEAPNMRGFFDNNLDNLITITNENEMSVLLINYAQTAERNEFLVTVEYSFIDGDFSIPYENKDFINALTGGLLEAYGDLCADIINEYRERLGEQT